MLSASRVLREVFLRQGIADADFPCYVAQLNDGPNQCIGIFDTSPDLQLRDQRNGFATFEVPGVHIAIRSLTYDAGWVKGKEIQAALSLLKPSETCEHFLIPEDNGDPYRFHSFRRTQSLTPVPNKAREEKNARYLFTIHGFFNYEKVI